MRSLSKPRPCRAETAWSDRIRAKNPRAGALRPSRAHPKCHTELRGPEFFETNGRPSSKRRSELSSHGPRRRDMRRAAAPRSGNPRAPDAPRSRKGDRGAGPSSAAANRRRTRNARHRLRGDGRTRPDRKVRKPSGGFTTKTDRRIPVRWGAARPPRRFAGRNAPPSRAARRVRRMDPVRIGNRDDRRSTRRPRGRRIAPFDECAAMTAPNPPSALPSGSRGRAPKAPRRAVRTLAPTLSRTINTNIALYLNRQDKTL